MSMPNVYFPTGTTYDQRGNATGNLTITIDTVLQNILLSIAQEESAIAHVINAEGEKIQWAIGTLIDRAGTPQVNVTRDQLTLDGLLQLNDEVQQTIQSLKSLECILRDKMWMALASDRNSVERWLDCDCSFTPPAWSCEETQELLATPNAP